MRISPELFNKMLGALLTAQESLVFFQNEHPDDDACELALHDVNQAILEAQKVKVA